MLLTAAAVYFMKVVNIRCLFIPIFWVYKDLSKSIREGIDQKLKTMAFPYKIKGWQKNLSRIYTFWRGLSAILTIYNQIFFPEVRPHWFLKICHF